MRRSPRREPGPAAPGARPAPRPAAVRLPRREAAGPGAGRRPRRRILACGLALALSVLAAPAAALCPERALQGFAAPSAVVEVSVREPGVLARLDVAVGDRVRAGGLVAALDSRLAAAELEAARARAALEGRLGLARARRDLAERRMAEVDKLRRSGSVRPLEIIEAETAVAAARGELAVAEDERTLARFEVARAEARLAQLELRAPIDGVVDEIHRDPGELAGAGDPRVVTIIALDPLQLDLYAPAGCLDGLAAGDAVAVAPAGSADDAAAAPAAASGPVPPVPVSPAPVRPDAVFPAAVRDIGRRVDAPTGLLRLRLDVPNPDGRLRAGDRLALRLPGGAP